MVTGANILKGRALARNGALTLDGNQITPPAGTCALASSGTPGRPGTPSTPGTGAGDPGSMRPALGLGAIVVGVLMVAVGRRRAGDAL
jgi:hypothetical protein